MRAVCASGVRSGCGIEKRQIAATASWKIHYSGEPAGQFDVQFEVRKGETTDLELKEEEMKPYVKSEIIGP